LALTRAAMRVRRGRRQAWQYPQAAVTVLPRYPARRRARSTTPSCQYRNQRPVSRRRRRRLR
jgi:hypothetical protein